MVSSKWITNKRAAIFVAVSLFALLLSMPVMAQDAKQASITYLMGDAQRQPAGEQQWQPVDQGDLLQEGDTVQTLDGALLKLQLASGSSIILKSNTTLSLNSLEDIGRPKTELMLSSGRIKAMVEELDPGSSFEVKTPSSVAGVLGTIFYLNVVDESEAILRSNRPAAAGAQTAKADPDILLKLADLFGVKSCYADPGNLITELFVEEGLVNFSNPFSNLFYPVGPGSGSSSDGSGNIDPPGDVPDDQKDQWQSGFGDPGSGQQGSGSSGGENKKGESSTVTTTGTGTGTTGTGLPGENNTGDPDQTNDDRDDNNSFMSTSTSGPLDSDGDGVPDAQDEFPFDAQWARWTGVDNSDGSIILEQKAGEPDDESVLITNGREDKELADELVDLYNDMAKIETSIALADLDNRWEQTRDSQSGKVVRDMHGNRVRLANYVLRPADNKVAIAFLSHRRDGEHAGVSSLTFEVAFNQAIPGDYPLTSLPWSDIMDNNEDGNIVYSSMPTYYPRPVESSPDASVETPAMVLTASNPQGDTIKVFQGFGDLVISGVSGSDQINYMQREVGLVNDFYVKPYDGQGVFKTMYESTDSRIDGEGTFRASFNFYDDSFFEASFYLIDDNGTLQNADIRTDGSSEPLDIDGITSLFEPDRANNLEMIFKATEFGNRSIDVIVAPELLRPYDTGDDEDIDYEVAR